MTNIFIRERRGRLDTLRLRAKDHVKREVEKGGQSQAEEQQGLPAATRSWERGMEWILSQSLQRSVALLTLWFQTSDLQNYEGVIFYCFKPPSFWSFVITSLGSLYTLKDA